MLGQSLRERASAGTSARPLVALVTDNVSRRAERVLEADGWRVVRTALVANPNAKGSYPRRFFGMYSKLATFGLHAEGCARVMYLDGDTLAVGDPDAALRDCPGFCANLKHSDRFNGGVEVLTPGAAQHRMALEAVTTVRSYTGGDQGMINEVFSRMADAPLLGGEAFERQREAGTLPEQHGQRLARLPAGYNADVGLYILPGNRWAHAGGAEAVRVLHFTLGPLKPWDWWAGWISPPFAALGWREVRARLPPEPPRKGLAASLAAALGWCEGARLALISLVPVALAAWACRAWLLAAAAAALRGRGGGLGALWLRRSQRLSIGAPQASPQALVSSLSAGTEASQVRLAALARCTTPMVLPALSIIAVVASLGIAVAVPALLLIPHTAQPAQAWVAVYAWVLCGGGVLLDAALEAIRALGVRAGRAASAGGRRMPSHCFNAEHTATPVSPAPHAAIDTLVLFVAVGACAVAVPWAPLALGVRTMIPNIAVLVAGGVAFLLAAVLLAPPAGAAWYAAGFWAGARAAIGDPRAHGQAAEAAAVEDNKGAPAPAEERV